jgi:hypothetical protein
MAIDINPRDAYAYDNQGFVYLVKVGNKGKGCADRKKAKKLCEEACSKGNKPACIEAAFME